MNQKYNILHSNAEYIVLFLAALKFV